MVRVAAPSTTLRVVPLPRFAVEDPRVASTATARDPPPWRSHGGGGSAKLVEGAVKGAALPPGPVGSASTEPNAPFVHATGGG